MTRIKINDLPTDLVVSKEEMKQVMGGFTYAMASIPYMSFAPTRHPGPFRPFFEVPSGGGEEAAGCGCMGMAQDPVECVMAPR